MHITFFKICISLLFLAVLGGCMTPSLYYQNTVTRQQLPPGANMSVLGEAKRRESFQAPETVSDALREGYFDDVYVRFKYRYTRRSDVPRTDDCYIAIKPRGATHWIEPGVESRRSSYRRNPENCDVVVGRDSFVRYSHEGQSYTFRLATLGGGGRYGFGGFPFQGSAFGGIVTWRSEAADDWQLYERSLRGPVRRWRDY